MFPDADLYKDIRPEIVPNQDNCTDLAADYNICTNDDCIQHKTNFVYPDEARCCDVCGSKTTYRYRDKVRESQCKEIQSNNRLRA
jgi:hypothetical protein